MAITRSQIARQLMNQGGVPRQGFLLGKLVRKIKDDIIPNELKSPEGIAAALTAANFAPKFIPGGSDKTLLQQYLPSVSGALETARKGTGKFLFGDKDDKDDRGVFGTVTDAITKPRFPTDDSNTKTSIGDRLLSGIFGPAGLAIGSGLLAGAFTKDKEDPIYTGQDVGLNLQDIAKLANITDPKTASAIGLRFSPDVEARKFTPAEMAETYAANAPVDFTEKREQAQDGGIIKEAEKYATQKESEFLRSVDINNIPRTGNLQREQERAYENAYKEYMERNKKADGGIMGDQKDFEEFLQDMQDRDQQMLQDRIMEDFEKFMKRKRMIDQMPEAKDGGIMKMADGGMMDMGGMEMDLRGGGFVPMGRAEKADDVPARLSKNEFVFTADAVRAAGGGDVDKGADKMYATMKKLEDRVA